MSDRPKPELKLRRLGINTYKEAVIYMREDCHVCRASNGSCLSAGEFQLHDRRCLRPYQR